MVILASELCSLRIGAPLSPERKQQLLALIDRIAEEHPVLWKIHNFPKGSEIFPHHLALHKESILNYPTAMTVSQEKSDERYFSMLPVSFQTAEP